MTKWARTGFPIAVLIATLMVLTMPPIRPALAENISITGRINSYYQLVAEDGTVFEVTDTELGDDLLSHAGARVQATGAVTEEGGIRYFDVKSFKVLMN